MIEFDLLPFFISMILMTVVTLWIGVIMRKHAVVMAVVIPIVLGSTVVSYTTIQGLLGYPIKKMLIDDSLYLYHIESMDSKYIFVWLIEPGDLKPRALVFANTDDNRKQAEEAKKAQGQGKAQGLKKIPSGEGQTQRAEFELYDFNPMQHVLKDNSAN